MLSKKLILEYQTIIKEEFGQDITYEEADRQGNNLVRYFEILAKADARSKATSK